MVVALVWPACRCSKTFCCKDLGITGRSCSITTGPTVTRECLWIKKSLSFWSQSCLLSDTPAWTVLWSNLYSSQVRQAASSLDQERAVGCEGEVIGDNLEWLLMPAIEASTRPVSNSSVSKAALASVGEGLRDMAATDVAWHHIREVSIQVLLRCTDLGYW